MKIPSVKERIGNLQKLKSLLDNKELKVHGVSYSNSFFSRRYLCRSTLLVNDLSIEDKTVKLTVATRIEQAGLQDVELTLDFLSRYGAGDIPGFTPEGMYEEWEKNTHYDALIPEPISITQFLISVDIMLKLTEPTMKYKEFTIAGEKFTLVELTQTFDAEPDDEDELDAFEQTVTLLFGDASKFSLLSHFYDKDLNTRDAKMILDLIVDENLTGKAIRTINCLLPSGVSMNQFPLESLISSYTTSMNDYIFGTGNGYVRITEAQLSKFKMECIPNHNGAYTIMLSNKQLEIHFIME